MAVKRRCTGSSYLLGQRFCARDGCVGGDSIVLKRDRKRPEKGPKSKFAASICMNSEKELGLYRFGPISTKEISILIQ